MPYGELWEKDYLEKIFFVFQHFFSKSNYFLKMKIQAKLNDELFKRIMILSSDSDISIRKEFSFQIGFILDILEQTEINKNLTKIVKLFFKL